MKRTLIIVIVISLPFLNACTKEKRIDRFQLLEMAQKIDPSVEPMIAKDLQSGVRCSKIDGTPIYGEGCIGAFQVKVGIIDMIVLEFENEKQAKREAERLGQWYYYNWVFDEVTGEPFLEEFVQKAFPAIYAGSEKREDLK